MKLESYKSASQRARVFSETWVASNFSCPSCTRPVTKTPNNTRSRDFECSECNYAFELKSKRGQFGALVADGAYQSMLESIRSDTPPHLILLSYTSDFLVKELVAIPQRFLVEEIVIPRRPLGSHCRRAGWQGCNLNLGILPPESRVPCISNFERVPSELIRSNWNKTAFLDALDGLSRSWMAVTMGLVRRLGKQRFSLVDLYGLEAIASRAFPNNSNVRAKLRQQLQVLRDVGWLKFEGNGYYCVTNYEAENRQ